MSRGNSRGLKKVLFVINLLSIISFASCGFAYKKRIVDNYYAVGVDTWEDISLSYNLGNGTFVDKAPGNLIKYGYDDTVIIAETIEANKEAQFYIIDRRKDSEIASEEKESALYQKKTMTKIGQKNSIFP